MFSYPKILGALGLVGLLTGGYFYVTGLQNDNAELAKTVAEQNISIESLTMEKTRFVEDLKTSKTNLSIVNKKFAKAQSDKEEILRIFGDHDFEKLLRAKPEWMGKKMTNGTRKVFRSIENESN